MTEDEINPLDELTPQEAQDLSVLLKTARPRPPEGFLDDFMREFSERLEEETRPRPLWVRVAQLIQTNKQMSAAVAILIIALIIPLSLTQEFFFLKGPQTEISLAPMPTAKKEKDFSLLSQPAPPTAVEHPAHQPGGFNFVQNQGMNLGAGRSEMADEAEPEADAVEDKLAASPPRPQNTTIPPALIAQGYNHQDFLVKQAQLGVEVQDLQKSFQNISQWVNQNKGYIVNSRMIQEEGQQAVAEIQVKLPRQALLTVIEKIEAEGIVRHKEISSQDIWLDVQRKKLEIESLEQSLKGTQDPASRRDLQQQIKEQKLEQLQFEQSLRMATLELRLFGPSVSRQWEYPVSENAKNKLSQSLRQTIDLLVEIFVILPPVLIYLACAFVIWRILKWLLIVKIALLQEKTLVWIYLLAVFFFPLSFAGEQEIQTVLLFVGVVLVIWALKTVFQWVREQLLEKRQLKIPDDGHDKSQ